jgi:hypothetical protein
MDGLAEMDSRDLRAALEPVREFFSGSHLNSNTVLAAYMRSEGLPVSGIPWQLAKAGVDAGMTFAEAVHMVAEHQSSEGNPPTAPVRKRGGGAPPTMKMQPATGVAVEPSNPAENEPKPNGDADSREVLHQQREPKGLEHFPTSRRLPSSAASLAWYPKRFGPGDLVGEGALRLLGTPNIPLVSVLVRETAQNSWDARTAMTDVRFTMNLRRVSAEERNLLAARIFTGSSPNLGLMTSLSRPDLRVLEISDRGTKGLGGPIRNDLATSPDEVTNFIDLIFNIGAPRDVALGAGTYGFGKTIAYQASRCGTVLFWSRSREDAGLEDRLIGSAFGESYADGAHRYTGRHWWGHIDEQDDRIEPVCGSSATELAEAIFTEGFGPAESGTSMLIVDPVLGGADAVDDARLLADAVLWHLWPKLVPSRGARTRMHIEVLLDGEPVELPDPTSDEVFAGYSDCLQLVRAVQDGETYTPQFNTELFEIRLLNPEKLLGHLAVARYPFRQSDSPSEIAEFVGPSRHVAYMRHDAELVVKYDGKQALETQGLQWAAVFKPVAAVDNSFAAAEPPAHDDWVPNFISDRAVKSEVNVALRRIREAIAQHFASGDGPHSDKKSGRSVAALADSLAGLIGAVPGPSPGLRKSKSVSPTPMSRRPRVEVLSRLAGPIADGRRKIGIMVRLDDKAPAPARLEAVVGVGTDGGVDADPDVVRLAGWVSKPDGDPLNSVLVAEEPVVDPGESVWLVLDVDPSVLVDVSVEPKALTR